MGVSKLRCPLLVHLVIHLSPIFIGIVCYMYIEISYLEASNGERYNSINYSTLYTCLLIETTVFFLCEEISDSKILSQNGRSSGLEQGLDIDRC